MRNTPEVIADCISAARTLEEAKRMIGEEIAKGDCSPITDAQKKEWIKLLWRVKADKQKKGGKS